MRTSLLFTFLAYGAAIATPTKTCDTSKATLTLPAAQPSGTALATPAGPPKFIAVAAGVQNYTCTTAGTYGSVGAFAELFDMSCLPSYSFNLVTDWVYEAWERAPAKVTAAEIISSLNVFHPAIVLGQHYFITNPSGGLSPKWDFTSASEAGHSDAFVIGVKTGDIPDPSNPRVNVDWLSLKNGGGDLADQVLRVQTRGGQPPSSCTPGSANISVRYASQYWFYGGSF